MLVLCLTCFLFTGCSNPIKDLKEAWNEFQDENADKKGEKETINLLEGIQGYNTNGKTKTAAINLADAQNAYSGAKAELKNTKSHWYDLWGLTPTKHNLAVKKSNEAKAVLTKSKTEYKTAVATDKTLAADKKKKAQGDKESFTKYLPYIFGAIVIIIIILLILSKMKKKEPEVDPEATNEEPSEDKKRDLNLLTVDYDKLLVENCTKCEINSNEVLSMFNGDARLASDAVQQCVAKQLKGEKAMDHIKNRAKHFKDFGN